MLGTLQVLKVGATVEIIYYQMEDAIYRKDHLKVNRYLLENSKEQIRAFTVKANQCKAQKILMAL